MESNTGRCATIYALLILAVVATAVIVRVVPGGPLAQAFTAPIIAVVAVAGATGISLVRRAGFPYMLDAAVGRRWRFAVPAGIGALFGVLTIAHAFVRPGGGPVTPFPVAILVFGSGAILLESFLRLFAITVPTALIGFFGPGARRTAFWIAATVTSLYEPLPFLSGALHGHSVGWSAVIVAARLFLFNFAGALLYRKAGFLAPLTERWSEYLVWHILGQSFLGLH